MIAAAAEAVAKMSDATSPGASLLPPMDDLRTVSTAVAIAVATAAAEEGLAQVELPNLIQQVHSAMWRPIYPDIEVHRSEKAAAQTTGTQESVPHEL
jgi:malate dehydrogenase (oxaloacetate-decarboxylating)